MADATASTNCRNSGGNGGERTSLLSQLQPPLPAILSRHSTATSQYASLGAASPAPSDGARSAVSSFAASPCLHRGSRKRRLQGNAALHINLLTALWGPACFAMPWAFQEAGLGAGSIGVLMVAALSYTTLILLIRTKRLFSSPASLSLSSDAAAAAAAAAAAGHGEAPTPPTPSLYGAIIMVGQEESGGEKGGDVDREEDKRRQVALNRLRQRQLLEEQRQWRARGGHEEELTYAQVAARALGRPASGLIKSATTISCLGACAAYLSFIVGMIVQLAPAWGEDRILLGFYPLLVLLSWVRGFRRLSFLNVLGNLSLVLGLVAIFYDGLSHGHHNGFSLWPLAAPAAATAGGKGKKVAAGGGEAIHWVNPSTLLLFFGPTAFLFVIHYCAVPIESESADPTQFGPALARSMALTALLNIVVGCAGYIFYGQAPLVRDPSGRVVPGCERNVCDNVLKNVEAGPVKTAIVVTFCMNLILAYEVMLIPPREYVERWLVTPSRPYHKLLPTKWQRNLIRTLLVLFTFVVASSVHQFGLLTGFVGAITDTLQGFILPPLIYSAAYKATLSGPERAALMAMSALGVCLMLTATYQNAGELSDILHQAGVVSRTTAAASGKGKGGEG